MVHIVEQSFLRIVQQYEFMGLSYPIRMPSENNQIFTIQPNQSVTIPLPDQVSLQQLNQQLQQARGITLDPTVSDMLIVNIHVSASDNTTMQIQHVFDTSKLSNNLLLPNWIFRYNIAQLTFIPDMFVMPYKAIIFTFTNNNSFPVTVQLHVVASLTTADVVKQIILEYTKPEVIIGDIHG